MALEEAMRRVEEGGGDELWVCGGAAVYEAAMGYADELILTEVKAHLGGGVAFPMIEEGEWEVTRREVGEPGYEWVWYERVRKGTGKGG